MMRSYAAQARIAVDTGAPAADCRCCVLWRKTILGLFIFVEALFFNVLLPGHTRGTITLDGKHSAAACCCCDQSKPTPGKGPAKPSQRDRDNCSLCSFAGALAPAVAVVLTLPELGLLKSRPIPESAAPVELNPVLTYLACGPPFASAPV